MAKTARHTFRHSKPSGSVIKEIQEGLARNADERFSRESEIREHQQIIRQALADKILGKPDDRVIASVKALSAISLRGRPAPDMHGGPHAFQMNPGFNVIAPPYDYEVHIELGSGSAVSEPDLFSGRFSAEVTASSGEASDAYAGVGVFLVPSHPSKHLAIRPYFEWSYSYTCVSHLAPSGHSSGAISTNASGHTGRNKVDLGGNTHVLWNDGSTFWHDTYGLDSGIYPTWLSEHLVSGQEYYGVNYVAQVSGDAETATIGGSLSFGHMVCRVPFIVVEERGL
jgi:hypothetical protein